jgi:hypothetical protein
MSFLIQELAENSPAWIEKKLEGLGLSYTQIELLMPSVHVYIKLRGLVEGLETEINEAVNNAAESTEIT